MKQIEDEFQAIANLIVSGNASLKPEEHASVSRFFVLWHLRASHRAQPEPDYPVKGVTGFPKELEAELGEKLEKSGVSFIRGDGTIPGRVVLGMQIQMHIDILMDGQFSRMQWGTLTALKGEFIIPDYIGLDVQVVPISPTICLTGGHRNSLLIASNVAKVNSALAAVAREYMIARDFTDCPF